jgi:hypothetical protein
MPLSAKGVATMDGQGDATESTHDLAAELADAVARIEWLEQQVARLSLHHDAARPPTAPPQMTGLSRSTTLDAGARPGRLRRL